MQLLCLSLQAFPIDAMLSPLNALDRRKRPKQVPFLCQVLVAGYFLFSGIVRDSARSRTNPIQPMGKKEMEPSPLLILCHTLGVGASTMNGSDRSKVCVLGRQVATNRMSQRLLLCFLLVGVSYLWKRQKQLFYSPYGHQKIPIRSLSVAQHQCAQWTSEQRKNGASCWYWLMSGKPFRKRPKRVPLLVWLAPKG